MKGFRKLVVLGLLLVTLLIIIDTIDARKKEVKKKEIKNINGVEEDGLSKKRDKFKKYNEETNKSRVKKEVKKTKKDATTLEDDHNTKTTKKIKRVKSFTIEEDNEGKYFETTTSHSTTPPPPTTTTWSPEEEEDRIKTLIRDLNAALKARNITAEDFENDDSLPNVDDFDDSDIINLGAEFDGTLNKMFDERHEDMLKIAERSTDNPGKGYKWVEVYADETEDNETLLEIDPEDDEGIPSIQRTESEEIKVKKTKTTKVPKVKRLAKKKTLAEKNERSAAPKIEESYSETYGEPSEMDSTRMGREVHSDDSYSTRYEDPSAQRTECRKFPVDPKRKSPTKVTLYVNERIVNGKNIKEVIPLEDGISLCEIYELMINENKLDHEEEP